MFCLYKDSNLKNVNREEAMKLSIVYNTINTKKETFTCENNGSCNCFAMKNEYDIGCTCVNI